MISVSIKLPNLPKGIDAPVKKSLLQATFLVRRESRKRAPYDTGTLRRSIIEKVNGMRGTVGTNVVYARIHEYGGTITPKKSKYLRFKVGGRRVTTKRVRIKAKPYMRPALKASKDKITNIFAKNIREYLGSNKR